MKIEKKIQTKKVIKIAIIIIAILIVASFTGMWMVNTVMNAVIHNRKEVIVPDIEGKTINEALTILSEKNLSLYKVAEKFDTNVPAGSIISQSPPPGLTVREGKAVESVISSGGKVVFVPEIEGKSMRQAELMLRQAELLMGEQIRTFSSTVKRDFVVTQEPASGEIIEKNSYINIVVSRGPAEEEKIKKMPNLLGIKVSRAEQALKELNLELSKIETTINDELDEGTVIKQAPVQGTIVDVNTLVELTISKQTRSLKEVREETIYYEVTQSGLEKKVKIVIADDIGERVVFEGKQMGGSKIEVSVKVLGIVKVKIYVDEILIKEEELTGIPIIEEDDDDEEMEW